MALPAAVAVGKYLTHRCCTISDSLRSMIKCRWPGCSSSRSYSTSARLRCRPCCRFAAEMVAECHGFVLSSVTCVSSPLGFPEKCTTLATLVSEAPIGERSSGLIRTSGSSLLPLPSPGRHHHRRHHRLRPVLPERTGPPMECAAVARIPRRWLLQAGSHAWCADDDSPQTKLRGSMSAQSTRCALMLTNSSVLAPTTNARSATRDLPIACVLLRI